MKKEIMDLIEKNAINMEDIKDIDVEKVETKKPVFKKFKKAIVTAGLIATLGIVPANAFGVMPNSTSVVQEVSAKSNSVKYKNKKIKKNQIIKTGYNKSIKISVPKKSKVKVTLKGKNKSSIANKVKKGKKVKFNKVGKYKITVTLKNNKKVNFYVKSVDKVKPSIKMNGSTSMEVAQNDNIIVPSVTAKDKIDGKITKKIKVNVKKGNESFSDLAKKIKNGEKVKFKTTGKYDIVYTVKDKAGNKATKTRTITVVKPKTNGTQISTEIVPETTEEKPPIIDSNKNTESMPTTEVVNNDPNVLPEEDIAPGTYLGEYNGKKYYYDTNYWLFHEESKGNYLYDLVEDYRKYDSDFTKALEKYNKKIEEEKFDKKYVLMGTYNNHKCYRDDKYCLYEELPLEDSNENTYLYMIIPDDYRKYDSDWEKAIEIYSKYVDLGNNENNNNNDNNNSNVDQNENNNENNTNSNEELPNVDGKYLGEYNNIRYYCDADNWIFHVDSNGEYIFDLLQDYREISTYWKEALGKSNENNNANEDIIEGSLYLGEYNGEKYYKDIDNWIYHYSVVNNEILQVYVITEDYTKINSDWKKVVEQHYNELKKTNTYSK